jgi:hypothetical protein
MHLGMLLAGARKCMTTPYGTEQPISKNDRDFGMDSQRGKNEAARVWKQWYG